MKNDLIVRVKGSSRLKFSPGHYCGSAWGFGVYQENWTAKESHHGVDGWAVGGVMDFKEVERLYKAMKAYKKKYKRVPLSELFK